MPQIVIIAEDNIDLKITLPLIEMLHPVKLFLPRSVASSNRMVHNFAEPQML